MKKEPSTERAITSGCDTMAGNSSPPPSQSFLPWNRLRFNMFALILLIGFISACSSKPPEDSEEHTCDLGVYDKTAEKCVNPTSCDDQNKCVAGYMCKNSTCTPEVPCSSDNDCATGTCSDGACINPKRCTFDENCISGYQCDVETNACVKSPCETECTRGVCNLATAECSSRPTCTIQTQETACIAGEYCHEGACKPMADVCNAIGCDNKPGVCDIDKRTCVNAQNCEGNDNNCLANYYCDETECKENKCSESGEACPGGGVCNKDDGNCINKESCDKRDDCVNGYSCIANVCQKDTKLCEIGGCKGNQICEYDEANLQVVCKEDPNGCRSALDCLDNKHCVDQQCVTPVTCTPDQAEDNNTKTDAAEYGALAAATNNKALTLCSDEDWYSYDTTQNTPSSGLLTAIISINPSDVGVKEVKAELIKDDKVLIAKSNVDATSGKASDTISLEQNINPVDAGTYYIRVYSDSQEDTLLKYDLLIDILDQSANTACQNVPELVFDQEITSEILNAPTQTFTQSCTSASEAPKTEDVIWYFTLTERSHVSIEATPSNPNPTSPVDIVLQLRSNCLMDSSELTHGCYNDKLGNDPETISRVLEAGTYYLLVTMTEPNTIGDFKLKASAKKTECDPSQNSCIDSNTSRECNESQTGYIETACDNGCDANLGLCKDVPGNTCPFAIAVDKDNPYSDTLTVGSYANNFQPGSKCPNVSSGATGGADAVFAVTVEAGDVAIAKATGEGKLSLYFAEDCDSINNTCVAGKSASRSDDPINLSWFNDSGATKTVYLVVDHDSSYYFKPSDYTVTIDFAKGKCQPNTRKCHAGGRESLVCNWSGTQYDQSIPCVLGCDNTTNDCRVAPGDRCDSAPEFFPPTNNSPGTQTQTGNLLSYNDLNQNIAYTCFDGGYNVGDREIFYKLYIEAGYTYRIKASAPEADVLIWFSTPKYCDATTGGVGAACITGVDNKGAGKAESFEYYAETSFELLVVVESAHDTQLNDYSFKLEITKDLPAGTPYSLGTCNGNKLQYYDRLGDLKEYDCPTTCTNGYCDNGTAETCYDAKVLYDANTPQTNGTVTDTLRLKEKNNPAINGTRGNCHFSTLTEEYPVGSDLFYRFDLNANDLLTIDYEDDSATSLAYFVKTCADIDTCFGLTHGVGSRQFSYRATQNESIYLVVKSVMDTHPNNNFEFDWSVDSTNTYQCAPGSRVCLSDTDLQTCDANGTPKTITCPGKCIDDICQVDPSLPVAGDTCADAISVPSDGGSFLIDTTRLTGTVDPACVGGLGHEQFYTITTTQPDQVIRVKAASLSGDTPSIYIFDDCSSVNTCEGTIGGSLFEYPAEIRYVAPTVKTYYIAIDLKQTTYSKVHQIYAEIEVLDGECNEQTDAPVCENGAIKYCSKNIWRPVTCPNGCTAGNSTCDTPKGTTCFDAVPLTGDNGTLNGQLVVSSSSQDTFSSRLQANQFVDSCLFNSGSYWDSHSPIGREKYYSVNLQKDDILDVTFTSSYTGWSTDQYEVYIMSGCKKNEYCELNNPKLSGVRTLKFQAKTAGTYYVVVDSSQSDPPTYPWSLAWDITRAAAPAKCLPFQGYCKDSSVLVQCTSNQREVEVTCADGCVNNHCVVPATANECATAPKVESGFMGAVPLTAFSGGHSMTNGSCVNRKTDGNDAFFQIDLPANSTLRAYNLNAAKPDTVLTLYIFKDCNDITGTCVDGKASDATLPKHGPAVYRAGGQPETVYVAMDIAVSWYTFSAFIFIEVEEPECDPSSIVTTCKDDTTLTFCNNSGYYEDFTCAETTGNPNVSCTEFAGENRAQCDSPKGDFCHDAINLTVDPTTHKASANGDFSTLTNTYDLTVGNRCTGTRAPGKDSVYRIVIPAGKTLTATVQSTATTAEDVAVYLADNCKKVPDSCVENLNGDVKGVKVDPQTGTADTSETITYTAGATDEVKYIFVDSWDPGVHGTFQLDVTVQ